MRAACRVTRPGGDIPSFPQKRESIITVLEIKTGVMGPRLRGDDGRSRPAGATGFGRYAWRDLFRDPQQHRFELPPIDTVRGHQAADERIGQRAPQRQFLTFWSHETTLHLVAAMHRAHAKAG